MKLIRSNVITVKDGVAGQAFAGGSTHPGTLELAYWIEGTLRTPVMSFSHFTAFNDEYHRGKGGMHPQGLAMDFTLTKEKNSCDACIAVREIGIAAGVTLFIKNEYKTPSARSTAGHIHVGFKSQEDAEKFLNWSKKQKEEEEK